MSATTASSTFSQASVASVTPATRRAAFASIYNQSHGLGNRARSLLPEQLRPIPLRDALDILTNDDSPHGDLHRARGLATLAAGGVHHQPEHQGPLNDFYHEHRLTESGDLHHVIPAGTPPDEARNAVHLMLSIPDKNQIRDRKLDVYYDSASQTTKTAISLSLNKSLDELAQMSDPRAWSRCSDLFSAGYEVESANGWGFGAPPRIPGPRSPLGQSWKSLFYEAFQLGYNAIQANVFENILSCDFNVPRNREGQVERIELRYSIRRAIRSRDLWLTRQGGIDLDFGEFIAIPRDDGWISVNATKNVRFTPLDRGHPNFQLPHMFVDIQNQMVPSVMAYWAEDWVEKSVACKLPPETKTSSSSGGSS